MKKLAVFTVVAVILAFGTGAWASTVVPGNGFWVTVANPSGVYYPNLDAAEDGGTSANDNQYYFAWAGGGLNALHVTTNPVNFNSGNVNMLTTTSNSPSGTLYISNTGGSGHMDDTLLQVAISGPIAPNFSVTVNASGYQWTANGSTPSTYSSTPAPGVAGDYWYATNTLGTAGVTATSANLIYGPQIYKPTGAASNGNNPFYSTQPTSGAGSTMSFMWIDLGVGLLEGSSLTNNGDAAVTYKFTGLYGGDVVALDTNTWQYGSNQGEGISWGNKTSTSSFAITDNATSPVPVPPSLFLLAGGFGGLGIMRRRWFKRN